MPKILLSTYSGYGNSFTIRLLEEGHDVDIYYHGRKNAGGRVLEGIVPELLETKPNFKDYNLVLFDLTGKPKLAEEAALETGVIGDGDFNTEIEDNRLLGIEVMEQCDINVPVYEVFNELNEAKRYVKKNKKRYVFKPFGGQDQDTASTYVSKDAEDLLRYLDRLGTQSHGAEFILQEVVQGTEISTEAWFNGEEFFLVNGTIEEKKLMNDSVGPATGCSGNLVWIYDELNPPLIFREGLQKMKDFLQQYKYKGMIDLNTIASESEVYGLEWTPRFGYDAAATLFSLITSNLGDFFNAIAHGARPYYTAIGDFAAGVRLSIPPYPSEIREHHPEGIPIAGIDEDDFVSDFYGYDMYLNGKDYNELVTAGVSGMIGVPIEHAESIHLAYEKVYDRIKKIQIPNLQYRTDMCKYSYNRYKTLSTQGWLR